MEYHLISKIKFNSIIAQKIKLNSTSDFLLHKNHSPTDMFC